MKLTHQQEIGVDSAGGTVTIDDDLGVTGIATFSQNVAVTGLTTTRTFQVWNINIWRRYRGTFVGTSSTVFATKLGVEQLALLLRYRLKNQVMLNTNKTNRNSNSIYWKNYQSSKWYQCRNEIWWKSRTGI